MAKITLIGMTSYFAYQNSSLWSNIILPDKINKETLIDTIILRCGEMETLYADADFFKTAVTSFFRKYNRTFTKWAKALEIEYNPLENYDRNEEWTDDSTGKSHDSSSGNNKGQSDSYVSAYNTSNLQTSGRETNSGSTSSSADTSMSNNATHKGRTHGNIGVTTSQQMLQSELDIAEWTIYNHIADLFTAELMVGIYY